jgi:hypothetical protein
MILAAHDSLSQQDALLYLCPVLCDLRDAVKGTGTLRKLGLIVGMKLLGYLHFWDAQTELPEDVRIHFRETMRGVSSACLDTTQQNLKALVVRGGHELHLATELWDAGVWSTAHQIARLEVEKTKLFTNVLLDPSQSERVHRMFYCVEVLRLASGDNPTNPNPLLADIYVPLRRFFFRDIPITDAESLQRAWKCAMSPGNQPSSNTAKRCRNYLEDPSQFILNQLFEKNFRPEFLWLSKPSQPHQRNNDKIADVLATVRDMISEQLPKAFQGTELARAIDLIRTQFSKWDSVQQVLAQVDRSEKNELKVRVSLSPLEARIAVVYFDKAIETYMTTPLKIAWAPVIK